MLVYGSDTNFTKITRGYNEVGNIFRISRRTVESVIRSFKKQNCDLENFGDMRSKR